MFPCSPVGFTTVLTLSALEINRIEYETVFDFAWHNIYVL